MELTVEKEMADNLLQTLGNRSVGTVGRDPFAAYGAKVATRGANFLSFKNGEWLYGQSDTMLPLGTRLAANMAGLKIGWRKWFGGQVAEDRLSLLIDQLPEEPRAALGDLDPQMWELLDGKPRDPWQQTNQLELVEVSSGATYLYSTSSKGGIGCIQGLCNSFGQLRRQYPADYTPIVETGNDFYTHPQYGKTYVPTLTIVGWLDAAGNEVSDDDEPEDEPSPPIQAKTEPVTIGRKNAGPTNKPKF